MTATQPRKHPLHGNIEKYKIRRVAVVDDAFDVVSLASLQEGEDKEFRDTVNEQDALLREYHKLVSGIDQDDVIGNADLTDEAVRLLWERRSALGAFNEVLERTLFRVLKLKVSQVERLCRFLKDELGIEAIQRFGTNDEIPNDKFDLAFIDYRFGPSRQDESVDRAVRWAKQLYQEGGAFIILMSGEAEARVRQETFRKDSELTRGLFEFIDKKEIADTGKLCNRLNSFCAGLDTRHEIHEFASTAEASVDQAAAALKEAIHALGLEDYAYLDQISLREDGHPLGDYMLWLFGEYFAHKLAVNESLQPARQKVNGIKYEQFLPLQRPPSVMLAKMYSAAITEPVHEGWGAHPRDTQENTPESDPAAAPAAQGATASDLTPRAPATATTPPTDAPPSTKGMPLYQIGDLLVATKDKPAYLVLNAGCDLQFSPGKRDCDPLQTILLLPGRFEPLHERGDETNVKRTELFELGGERLRIIWQHTRAVAIPSYKVRSEHEPKGYNRDWRLRLPYALEIQQHFAAQLTRVGVPTLTPVFREGPVDVYGKAASGDFTRLGTIKSGIIVFHNRDMDQFILTVDCVHEVLDHIDRFAATIGGELRLDPDAAPLSDEAEKRVKRRKKYLDDLRESRESLAHFCLFQATLNNLPALDGSLPQIEVISDTNKPHRLEVKHAATLGGRFASGGAPVVLAFSIPDITEPMPTAGSGAQPSPSAPPVVETTSEESLPQ